MSLPANNELRPSPRTFSVSAVLANTSAVHASVAGTTGAQVITAGLTNPIPAAGILAGGKSPAARIVTVTTGASAASYNTGAGNVLTVKGTAFDGTAITDVLTLTAAGGGETVATTKAFVTVTEIDIPIQPNGSGTFSFGVSDLAFSDCPREMRSAGAGALGLGYADGSSDVIPLVTAGEHLPYSPARINAATTTITAGITFAF